MDEIKTYKHPKIGRIAEYNELEKKYSVYDNEGCLFNHCTEYELEALLFEKAQGAEKDWIDELYYELDKKQALKTNPIFFRKLVKQYLPEPVEPVLIPLDVEAIVKEYKELDSKSFPVTRGELRNILSKYGVPTEQALVTSTIEELADNIFYTVSNYFNTSKSECETVYEEIKLILSSLSPIEKKRTRDDVLDRVENNSELLEGKGEKGIINAFLKDHNLLQE